MTRIVTARLHIRSARPKDLEAFHALVSDFEVAKMTASFPYPADRAFTRTRCVPVEAEKGLHGLLWAGSDCIGSVGCIEGELGYMLARPHWGKGYATEAARAICAAAFATYDWPEIRAAHWADNAASGRVLDKLGFQRTGTETKLCRARGTELTGITYRLPRP